MKPELYQEIALTQDWEEFNLHRGDMATLIDYVPSPTGGEEGAILEVFNGGEMRSPLSQFQFLVLRLYRLMICCPLGESGIGSGFYEGVGLVICGGRTTEVVTTNGGE
ncbi:hypothetical protein [Laspinema olomoucense]|uniref:hypothetical protein n=1 Tax=Laspinema olomoucense TaxID=3231600 RepID=UPI0021BB69F5|nr:hypothetical protein [Laspinema sp. D3c]MCT7992934.1 hypothetical protein [Laspinema sp. D3c]